MHKENKFVPNEVRDGLLLNDIGNYVEYYKSRLESSRVATSKQLEALSEFSIEEMKSNMDLVELLGLISNPSSIKIFVKEPLYYSFILLGYIVSDKLAKKEPSLEILSQLY
jgi:hypothetical protein